jgi:hypothetical protein
MGKEYFFPDEKSDSCLIVTEQPDATGFYFYHATPLFGSYL